MPRAMLVRTVALTFFTHEEAVGRARRAVASVSLEHARRAFIRSLGRDRSRLTGRAALTAFALAQHLPDHAFRPTTLFSSTYLCGVCGFSAAYEGARCAVDLDLTCEHLNDDGMIPFLPEPAALACALEEIAAIADAEPSEAEVAVLRAIVSDLERVVAEARACKPKGPMRKEALAGIGVALRSNKYARAWILQTLGDCGILVVPGRPAFDRGFTPFDARPDPPERNNELRYPTSFWRAEDGLDHARLLEVFPELV